MDRLPLLLCTLVVALLAAGCLGGDAAQPEVTFEIDVHPPDESVDNRSDIDDFETLKVTVKLVQLYGINYSQPTSASPVRTFDFTELADGGAQEITDLQARADRYDRWTTQIAVQEAVHKNGSRPEIHTSPSGIYRTQYTEENATRLNPGEHVTFRFLFAVTQDTEDIGHPGVPEGEYFIRLLPQSAPRR